MREVSLSGGRGEADGEGWASEFWLSDHAIKRMAQRAIQEGQIQLALECGRLIHSRHARFYVIGKREVLKLRKDGIEAESLEGLQVVVDEKTNAVLTAYRNKNLRKIRPNSRRHRHLH